VKNERSVPSVTIIDDDRSMQRALKDLLESAGVSARCFGSAEEFLEWSGRNDTACLVLDVRLPGMTGLELQAKLEAEGSGIPIIFISAQGDPRLKTKAMQAGAVEFLSKPFDDGDLLEKIRSALWGSAATVDPDPLRGASR
jgi:FixJ family two-component response regulator